MHKIILGFDFGLSKIGVAIGQMVTCSATPLTLLKAKRGVPDWQLINQIIKDWDADAIVIGLPLNMDGTEQYITRRAREFGEALKKQFTLPIYFSDERLTTIAARDEMHTHLKGAARFENADSVSAKLIVESWMRSQ